MTKNIWWLDCTALLFCCMSGCPSAGEHDGSGLDRAGASATVSGTSGATVASAGMGGAGRVNAAYGGVGAAGANGGNGGPQPPERMVDTWKAGEGGSIGAGAGGSGLEPSIIEPQPIDCTVTENVLNGWSQLVGENSVLVWNERAVVELEYAITLNDHLRDVDSLFNHVLADRFRDFERVLPPDYNRTG